MFTREILEKIQQTYRDGQYAPDTLVSLFVFLQLSTGQKELYKLSVTYIGEFDTFILDGQSISIMEDIGAGRIEYTRPVDLSYYDCIGFELEEYGDAENHLTATRVNTYLLYSSGQLEYLGERSMEDLAMDALDDSPTLEPLGIITRDRIKEERSKPWKG